MKTTGEKLRELRLRRGRTLDEVGAAIGSSATTISKYEADKVQNIPRKKLEGIAEFLEISPSYLLGYDDPEIGGATYLSISEQLMLEDYRQLSIQSQETVNLLVQRLLEVETSRDKPVQLTL